MSLLSNKYKLDVKVYSAQVAKFISCTDAANIKLIGNNSVSEHSIFGHRDISNFYLAVSSNTIATFNNLNISFYKDTVIRGNLVIDGNVVALGIDIAASSEDLFFEISSYTDITSNLLIPKYMQIANSGIINTSNIIMQALPYLSEQLYIDGLDVVTSNTETIYFLQNNCNYSIEKFDYRFSQKTADDFNEGINNNFFVNSKYLHNSLTINGDTRVSNIYSTNDINSIYTYACEYFSDGSKLQNIYIGDSTTNALCEGSNLFFNPVLISDILQSCNLDALNYTETLFDKKYYHDVILQTEIYDYINLGIIDVSNYSSDIYIECSFNDDHSNYILLNEMQSSNYLTNIDIIKTYYDITNIISNIHINTIIEENDNTSKFVTNVSNILYANMYKINHSIIQHANNILSNIEDEIYNRYDNISNLQILFLQDTTQKIQYDREDLYTYINTSSNHFAIYKNISYTNCSNAILKNSNVNIEDLHNDLHHQNNEIDLMSTYIYQYINDNEKIYLSEIINIYVNASNLLNSLQYADVSNLLIISSNYLHEELHSKYLNILAYDNYIFHKLISNLDDINDISHILSSNIYNKVCVDFNSQLQFLDTNLIANGTSNFYYTEEKFNEIFSTLSADYITDGLVNRWIINNEYYGDLNIVGTLYASNLIIDGEISTINTNVYQSGKCIISSSNNRDLLKIIKYIDGDEVSKIINNTGNSLDIFKAYDVDNKCILYVYDSNVCINKTNNIDSLHSGFDISGNIYATIFHGNSTCIYNVNLSDKNTDLLQENGSNLYFTNERVSFLIDMSNIDITNYIQSLSNIIYYTVIEHVKLENNLYSDSNYLYNEYIQNKDTSNNLQQVLTEIKHTIIDEDIYLYDYIQNISNVHLNYIDSPSSTSSITYTAYMREMAGGGGSIQVQRGNEMSTMILMEVAG